MRTNDTSARLYDYDCGQRETHTRAQKPLTRYSDSLDVPEFVNKRPRTQQVQTYRGQTYSTQTRPPQQRRVQGTNTKYNQDGDYLEVQNQRSRKAQDNKKSQHPMLEKMFIGLVKAFAVVLPIEMAIAAAISCIASIMPPKPNFDACGNTAAQVEQFTGVDARAILLANKFNADDALNEIVLPEKANLFEDEIAEITKKLENKKLTNAERKELEAKLETYQARQAARDALGQLYMDEEGKFAYFVPNERGTSAEDVKDAFGIKDGVIRNHNDLDYSWGRDSEHPEYGAYRDYTGSSIPYKGIKIPLDTVDDD